ncbi:MAG: c-type cytochrome [Deltaproteobacteria bacterium]|nr:c-type cytochrome [Deltaproteobacteria bacterium]
MNVRANKLLLLLSSLATLALLGFSAYRENVLEEWRVIQRRYARELPPDAAAEFNVQLRQIVAPALDVTDRCVSCHVGMAPGEQGIKTDRLFAKHRDVVHDPADLGCTTCHGGQGRATEKDAAHGDIEFWPEPMIPARYSYAGCGRCHTHLAVPNLDGVARGRDLLERYDCLACHKLEGRGGTLRPGGAGGMEGPDLSRVGAKGIDPSWYDKHEAARDAALAAPTTGAAVAAASSAPATPTASPAAWKASFSDIGAEDRAQIEVFLSSRFGAPELIESKALFHSLGCRGCHKLSGVGGDDGPDLTKEGLIDPGRRAFSHVPGKRTVANWLAAHFRAPSVVMPGSAMPEFGLDERSIDRLVFYMLSLRHNDLPEKFLPDDRALADRFGKREFAADGATLYGSFCAACHGPSGEGMRYPGMTAFPAIGNRDFLAVASDDFLRATITHGRVGRRMPAWGETSGGLHGDEIETVVGYLRTLGGDTAFEGDDKPPRWVVADARRGGELYAAACASCHGASGEGKEGPALSNAQLLASATDTYLVRTIGRGRRGTAMLGFTRGSTVREALSEPDIESIVAFVRTWEKHR